MSVPVGALTPAYRAGVLAFHSASFGWQAWDHLPTPDRLTIAIECDTHINIRERQADRHIDAPSSGSGLCLFAGCPVFEMRERLPHTHRSADDRSERSTASSESNRRVSRS